jgi:hypothetical protein
MRLQRSCGRHQKGQLNLHYRELIESTGSGSGAIVQALSLLLQSFNGVMAGSLAIRQSKTILSAKFGSTTAGSQELNGD